MPFCTGCGVRIEGNVQRCPACENRAAVQRRCPQCGAPAGSAASRFCVACGAPMGTVAPAAPGGVADVPAGGPALRAAAGSSGNLVEATRRERQAVYQRLGRALMAACYEGTVAYSSLPQGLAQQIQAGIQAIRKGHAGLIQAGICPRCLEAGLAGDPRTCPRCHLVVPPPRTDRAAEDRA